jgi:hypothetical protein
MTNLFPKHYPMTRYPVNVFLEDGVFVATRPDFPGIRGMALTPEKAIQYLLNLTGVDPLTDDWN